MNADRLREAANRLDSESATYWDGARFVPIKSRQDDATAALLRALADDLEIGLYIVGAESPAAALALADAILGTDATSQNRGLGVMRDSPELLRRAAAYIERAGDWVADHR